MEISCWGKTLAGGENRTIILSFRSLCLSRLRRRKQAYSVRPGSKCPVASLNSVQDKNQSNKKDPIHVFPSVDAWAEQSR